MGQKEGQVALNRPKSSEEASHERSPHRQLQYWQQKDQRFSEMIRCHVLRFHRQCKNYLPQYCQQYAKYSQQQKQGMMHRFQMSKEFCLRDKETTAEITAWYICLIQLLQYFDRLEAIGKEIEDEQQRLKAQKANIEKAVNCWNQKYAIRLEERRQAELREKETILGKIIRSVIQFCGRMHRKFDQQQSQSVRKSLLSEK